MLAAKVIAKMKAAWHVPGLQSDDVRADLVIALRRALDHVDDGPVAIGTSPGFEASLAFLVREKNSMRRKAQIREARIVGLPQAIHSRTPHAEDLVLASERSAGITKFLESVPERMTARQREYFDAICADARKHGYVSEVRVAEKMGRHKAQVSRAIAAICRSLRASGAAALVDDGPRPERRGARRLWRRDVGEDLKAPAPMFTTMTEAAAPTTTARVPGVRAATTGELLSRPYAVVADGSPGDQERSWGTVRRMVKRVESKLRSGAERGLIRATDGFLSYMRTRVLE